MITLLYHFLSHNLRSVFKRKAIDVLYYCPECKPVTAKNNNNNNNALHKTVISYDNLHTLPFFRDNKICPIAASRVVHRNKRWIKWKRIYNICIYRPIKSVHLPIWRNCSIRENKIMRHCHRIKAAWYQISIFQILIKIRKIIINE